MRIKKAIRVALIHLRVFLNSNVGERTLPSFIIAGVQKGGTSSLYYYLDQHPDVHLPLKKETNYFDLYIKRGINWYKGFFPILDENRITGEATPSYFFHPKVPLRIAQGLPAVKIIILLRDPIERAFSHYKMEVRRHKEPNKDFLSALKLEQERLVEINNLDLATRQQWENNRVFSYASRGLYSEQVQNWVTNFDKNQILFLKSEEFFSEPQKILNEVCDFIGIEHFVPRTLKPRNVGSRDQVPEDARLYLENCYQGESKKLVSLLGEKFKW